MDERASSALEVIFVFVGLGMFFYHMVTTQYLFVGAYEHQDIHLGFLLILTFLATMRKYKKGWVWGLNGFLILLTIIGTVYVFANMTHLEEVIGYPEPMDMLIGIILIILVLEGTRQAWGWTLPIVAMSFVAYFFLGNLDTLFLIGDDGEVVEELFPCSTVKTK